jgi:hypothetical protein
MNAGENRNVSREGTIMGEKKKLRNLPVPSRLIDRAAEAAGDAGDLGAELLYTGVDAATSVIGRLTSPPEEITKPPRRHDKKASGSAGASKRVGATVKRAAESRHKRNATK